MKIKHTSWEKKKDTQKKKVKESKHDTTKFQRKIKKEHKQGKGLYKRNKTENNYKMALVSPLLPLITLL